MGMQKVSNRRTLYICEDSVLSYKSGWLFFEQEGKGEQKLRIGGVLNRFPLPERILRKEPRCAARIDSDHFAVSFDGEVLNYSAAENRAAVEHTFDKGMHNPLEFLSIQEPGRAERTLYYGEYIWNPDKGPVSVYKRADGKWSRVFSFAPNTVTHIHNVVEDRYRDGFILLTGDEDSESGLWFADREFRHVRPLLVGKQQYRACVAFPLESGILYATDTPLEDNGVYLVELDERNDVRKITRECDIPGPCIYGAMKDGSCYFATSVEPDSTLPPWRYRMTYRLGQGVKTRTSCIVKRDGNGTYTVAAKAKKDLLPIWLCQFGNFLFPQNEARSVYAVAQSLRGLHGKTVMLKPENEEKAFSAAAGTD